MEELTNQPRTPSELGYRWPAEWEPHAATWLAWPHNPQTWPGKFEVIPSLFAKFVAAVADFEPVKLLAGTGDTLEQAKTLVGALPGVELLEIETNDAWVRDYGPMFLHGKGLPPALVDWGYNAWGNKYPPFDKDDDVPRQIAQKYNYESFEPNMILEGGAVDGNGAGCILTTESCLLNPTRNAHFTRQQIEEKLFQYASAKKILWLKGGEFAGDDTDGHVDQLARFVAPDKIVIASVTDDSDENATMLRHMRSELAQLTDMDGKPFEIIELPIPAAKYYSNQRLPASYCNFCLVNGGVVVPQFDDPADDQAVGILTDLFSQRVVMGLPATDLIWGLGAFHCLSQQEPLS
jgi:agmatine deiminase